MYIAVKIPIPLEERAMVGIWGRDTMPHNTHPPRVCLLASPSRCIRLTSASHLLLHVFTHLTNRIAVTIAYLINRYPDFTHTFIRREVAAIEALGCRVLPFTIRPPRSGLIDKDDLAEAQRTQVILAAGPFRLMGDAAHVAVTRPRRFLRAVKQAMIFSRRARGRIIAHTAYLLEACHLLRKLSGHQVDLLHAHFGTNPAAVAALVRLLGGPPFSFTIHGPEEFETAAAISLCDKVEQAASVVCVCRQGADQVRRLCGERHTARVRVVHCGVDAPWLDRESSPVPDEPRLVSIGRLSHQKDQHLLLRSLKMVIDRGYRVSLVLIGDGSLRSELQRQIAALGLEQQVTLAGWLPRTEIVEEILSSRALVLSSRAEGIPLAIMEAFAARRPVIATDVGGVVELVDSSNGWLVPSGDCDALADAMEAALTGDNRVLDEMGRRGYDRVAADFNCAQEAAKLKVMFAEIDARQLRDHRGSAS